MRHVIDSHALPFAAELNVAGARVKLRSSERAIRDALLPFIARTGNSSEPISLRIVATPSARSSEAPYFRGVAHIVSVRFPLETLAIDVNRRTVLALVHPSADPTRWRRVLLPIIVGVLGTRVGVVPMHCACIARGKDGVLIAGVSGAGKSTLSVAFAKRGYKFVSDDWTYVRCEHKALVAEGLRAPVKLLPDASKHFPELRSESTVVSLNGERAYEVDQRVLSLQCADVCRPRAVVILRRSSADCDAKLVPVSAMEVMKFFLGSAERLPEGAADALRHRTRVVGAVAVLPAFAFEYSGLPSEGAERLERALRRMQWLQL